MAQVPASARELRELAYSPEAVALALHSRRVAEGETRMNLARRIRVTEGTIHNWEQGKMPIASARLLSYIYEAKGAEELWRERALAAEAALKAMQDGMTSYRVALRRIQREQRNGGSDD